MNSERHSRPAPFCVTRELPLGKEQARIIDALQFQQIADDLAICSPATIVDREVRAVPLITSKDERINPKDALLSYRSAITHTGDHTSRMTLPNLTLLLEGRDIHNPEEIGHWRNPSTEKVLTHTDVVKALSVTLSKTPHTDTMLDTTTISNREITDAMWDDFTHLSNKWRESHIYSTSSYLYAPPINEDESTEYTSLSESVVNISDTPHTRRYRLRASATFTTDPSIYDRPTSDTPYSHGTQEATVDKSFLFELEVERTTNNVLRSIANLAIESSTITAHNLEQIALRDSLSLRNTPDLLRIYQSALDNVTRGRLI